MYKLIGFLTLLAVCLAAPAPKPQVFYSSPAVVPVAHVVPAVSTYSSYSSSVIHPPTIPVIHTPVVHAAHVVPVAYHAPAAFYIKK